MENSKEHTTIKKMSNQRKKAIESLPEEQEKTIEDLINAINSAGIQEFTEYIRSPWKMFFPNLIAGIARGVGTLLGAALILTAVGWIFTITVGLPLIGKKIEPSVTKVQTELNKYIEQTNYQDEFRSMLKILEQIEANTQK